MRLSLCCNAVIVLDEVQREPRRYYCDECKQTVHVGRDHKVVFTEDQNRVERLERAFRARET